MNASEWRALANEYYDIADQNHKAGNDDAARYWLRAADACLKEAKRLEAARQPQSGSEP